MEAVGREGEGVGGVAASARRSSQRRGRLLTRGASSERVHSGRAGEERGDEGERCGKTEKTERGTRGEGLAGGRAFVLRQKSKRSIPAPAGKLAWIMDGWSTALWTLPSSVTAWYCAGSGTSGNYRAARAAAVGSFSRPEGTCGFPSARRAPPPQCRHCWPALPEWTMAMCDDRDAPRAH